MSRVGTDWRALSRMGAGATQPVVVKALTLTSPEFKTALGALRRNQFTAGQISTFSRGMLSQGILFTVLETPLPTINEANLRESLALLSDIDDIAKIDLGILQRPLLQVYDLVTTMGAESVVPKHGYKPTTVLFEGKNYKTLTLEDLLGINV